jgi:hypothetical protein
MSDWKQAEKRILVMLEVHTPPIKHMIHVRIDAGPSELIEALNSIPGNATLSRVRVRGETGHATIIFESPLRGD